MRPCYAESSNRKTRADMAEKERIPISAIVPCYNEASLIETCYREISRVLVENFDDGHEILFVDDGSDDGTLELLAKICAADDSVRVISLSRRFGKESALSAGLIHCRGDLALLIDADLQDPPSLLSEMLSVLRREECNVVYGVRKSRRKDGLFKRLTAKLYYRVLSGLSETDMPVDAADFKLVDRHIIEAYRQFGERNKYVRGLLYWAGFKQVPLYYDRADRISGKTKFTACSLAQLATTGILYFSKKPLQIIITFGLFCIAVGVLLLIWMLVSVLSPAIQPASGWSSIITAVVFFSGVQLLTLGVIGGYIGNIFDEVKRRPEYIVKRYINFGDG